MTHAATLYQEDKSLLGSTLSNLGRVSPAHTIGTELNQLSLSLREMKESERYTGQTIMVEVSRLPPPWVSKAIGSLNSLLALDEDWDSYGARKVSPDSASTAFQILGYIMADDTPLPSIVPTTSGNVQLEWHRSGIDLEVEVTPSGKFSMFYEDELDNYENDSLAYSGHNLQILFGYVDQITQRAEVKA